MGLNFNLVYELAALNQYAATRDSQSARIFRNARGNERQIWADLAPYAADLGPVVQERFVEARTIAELWHERLNEEELLSRGTAIEEVLRSKEVTARFEQVLQATARLDLAIITATERSRTEIETAERDGMLLTFASVALAVLAAGVVGKLVLGLRRLAEETERRRRETAAALAQSARETEARQRLLRGITHDVKNPLGAARGYAELLGMGIKGPLSGEQTKLVQGVERSIDGALAIISDLLDLARADSGGIHIQRMNVDLNDLMQQAVEDHRAAAVTAGHQIVARSTVERLYCYTDPSRVRQVLDNLISNAIKYTGKPGAITVLTEPNAPDAPFPQRSVAIRVKDNGPGIPPDQRESIFDEFTRLDDGGAMKGHGLGLAIARRMARLLGGELGLVNDSSPGTTFTLWLPQREQREVSDSGSSAPT